MNIHEAALERFPPSMAVEGFPGEDDRYVDDEWGYDEAQRSAFKAGAEWAQTEAEGGYDEQLAAAESQVEVLRERLAAAEAVIEKVRKYRDKNLLGSPRLAAILDSTQPVVLAAHDGEVAAREVEAVASKLAEPSVLWWSGVRGPEVQTDEATGARVSLDEWFAGQIRALRSGTEAETGDNR